MTAGTGTGPTPGTGPSPGTGPAPSTGPTHGAGHTAPAEEPGTYDPLRLCVYATVALLAWLLGPVAVLFFAGLGLAGYIRARRAGLRRSRCVLRDTRLVLAYLGAIAVVATVALVLDLTELL